MRTAGGLSRHKCGGVSLQFVWRRGPPQPDGVVFVPVGATDDPDGGSDSDGDGSSDRGKGASDDGSADEEAGGVDKRGVDSETRRLRGTPTRHNEPSDGDSSCASHLCRRVPLTAWHGWSSECLSRRRWHTFAITQALPQVLAVGLEEWQVRVQARVAAPARCRSPCDARCTWVLQLQLVAVFAAKLGEAEIATHNTLMNFFQFLSSFMFALVDSTSIRTGCVAAVEPRAHTHAVALHRAATI